MYFEFNYTTSVTINLSIAASKFEKIIQATMLLAVFSTGIIPFKTRRHDKVIDLPFGKSQIEIICDQNLMQNAMIDANQLQPKHSIITSHTQLRIR